MIILARCYSGFFIFKLFTRRLIDSKPHPVVYQGEGKENSLLELSILTIIKIHVLTNLKFINKQISIR
ncbi:MAG: hypothetical protein AAF349_24185, partial [Cyanobacteria bacterium P01_A01_bin.68]